MISISAIPCQILIIILALRTHNFGTTTDLFIGFNTGLIIWLLCDGAALVWTCRREVSPPGTMAEIFQAHRMGLTRDTVLQYFEKYHAEVAAEAANIEAEAQQAAAREEAERRGREERMLQRFMRSDIPPEHADTYRSQIAALSRAPDAEVEDFFQDIAALVAVERRRTNIRRRAHAANVDVELLLAQNAFDAAEANITRALAVAERVRELAALRARIEQLPSHLRAGKSSLVPAIEAALHGTDREWRQAVHPLRRALEG